MSLEITTAFVKQFERGITHLAEQKESRFRQHVRFVPHTVGDQVFIDQIGSVTAQPFTDRHADTPITSTPHSRRSIQPVPYKHADLIDKSDDIRVLNNPQSSYVRAFGRAFGRAKDDVIIASAFAVAKTGVSGGTSTSFDSTNFQIAAGGTRLTLAKILDTNVKLRAAENDPEDGFFFAVSQQQLKDLLGDSTISSADYTTVRMLMSGTVTDFMGFTWIPTERLGVDSSSNRRCIAWARNSLALTMADEITTRITERDDKNFSTQVFMSMDLGATRMDETGVVEVLCSEA